LRKGFLVNQQPFWQVLKPKYWQAVTDKYKVIPGWQRL